MAKVIIAGSMTLSRKMLEVEQDLLARGVSVVLPEFAREYALLPSTAEMHKESAKNKIEHDLIRRYFATIAKGDLLLVVNEPLHGIPDYIGGNAFLEMGFAHVLRKPIYLLNGIPDMPYADEINAMLPIALHGNLGQLVAAIETQTT
jgi:nucleoside 2-deoxyribosyltransferase